MGVECTRDINWLAVLKWWWYDFTLAPCVQRLLGILCRCVLDVSFFSKLYQSVNYFALLYSLVVDISSN